MVLAVTVEEMVFQDRGWGGGMKKQNRTIQQQNNTFSSLFTGSVWFSPPRFK